MKIKEKWGRLTSLHGSKICTVYTDSVKWTRVSSRKGQRIKAMRCEILIEITDNKESVNLTLVFSKKRRTSRARAAVKEKTSEGKKNQCVYKERGCHIHGKI